MLMPKHQFDLSELISYADNESDAQSTVNFALQDLKDNFNDEYSRRSVLSCLLRALGSDVVPHDSILEVLDNAVSFQNRELYLKALAAALKIPNKRGLATTKIIELIQRTLSLGPGAEINWDSWYVVYSHCN